MSLTDSYEVEEIRGGPMQLRCRRCGRTTTWGQRQCPGEPHDASATGQSAQPN